MKEAYTFDDVLIVPRFSEVGSRRNVSVSTTLGDLKLRLPIISSNMTSVTDVQMARKISELGGLALLHRFCSIDENVSMFENSVVNNEGAERIGVSVGINEEERDRAACLVEAGARVLCIDVAHGAQQRTVDQVVWIRENLPKDVLLIVGNFASVESIREFKNRTSGVDVFKVGVGPGCLGAGTRVLMADGSYKNIEDIKVRDRVINKYGRPVDVTAVKYSGKRLVNTYRSNIFYKKTEATPDHRHYAADISSVKSHDQVALTRMVSRPTRTGESKIQWIPTERLGGNVLLMPKDIRFEIPETFSVSLDDYAYARRDLDGIKEFPTLQPSYDLGYVFGMVLGDGHAKTTTHVHTRKGQEHPTRNTAGDLSIYLHKDQNDIAEKVVRCFESIFDYTCTVKDMKSSNLKILRCRCAPIARFFASFGKKEEKALPKELWCSDEYYLQGLYDGLLDSDGFYAKDGREGFTNTSPVLMEQFMILFYLTKGYFPSLQVKEPNKEGQENWKVGYSARSVKNPQWKLVEDFQITRLKSLSGEEYITDTYDIEVDCDSHSFIANNTIVHNSVCSTRLKAAVGYPQFSAIMECATEHQIIADGGCRNPGHVCKSLAAGGSAVMLGFMLAGTDEAPGVEKDGTKILEGSASGGYASGWKTSEGVSMRIPCKGPVEKIIRDIEGGLRSSMSYVGAFNIEEYWAKVEFVRVTPATVVENAPVKI